MEGLFDRARQAGAVDGTADDLRGGGGGGGGGAGAHYLTLNYMVVMTTCFCFVLSSKTSSRRPRS